MFERENLDRAEAELMRTTSRMEEAGLDFGIAVQKLERILAEALPDEDPAIVSECLSGLYALPTIMVSASKDIENAFSTVADTTRRLIAAVED